MQVKKVEKLTTDLQDVLKELYQTKIDLDRLKKEVSDIMKLVEKLKLV